MKILHPTDFSVAAEKARQLALSLAERLAAELTVVHVQEHPGEGGDAYPFALVGTERMIADVHQRQEEARTLGCMLLRQRLERLTPADGRSGLLWGKPLAELLAILPDYDLVVMGAHGVNRLDNYVMGGLAGRLVRRSAVPVMTVRDACRSRSVRRILYASDFSEAAHQAWPRCLKLAEEGLELVLAHVLPAGSGVARIEEAVLALEALSRDFRARHVIRSGDPVRVLPEIAAEVAADAIAIGVKRRSAAAGLLLGSCADGLIRSSPAPVLAFPEAG